MASIKEKIEQFKSEKGIDNFEDYLLEKLDFFVEDNFPTLMDSSNLAIGECIGDIWENYSKEYLDGLDIDFATTNEEELLDIVQNFSIFPYTYDSFKNSSVDIKWEILKNIYVDKVDSDFFTEELVNKILTYIGDDISKINDFGKAIFFGGSIAEKLCEIDASVFEKLPSEVITKELIEYAMKNGVQFDYNRYPPLPENVRYSKVGMEYLCSLDGQWLRDADSSIITRKLIEIAMNNPSEDKRFKLEDINKQSWRLFESKEGMEYICSLDGRMLRHADVSVITSDLIKIAMKNGFTLEDVPSSAGLCESKEGMEYICSLDGRMIKHADPSVITRQLIESAMNHEDENKRPNLLYLLSQKLENEDLVKYISENISSGSATMLLDNNGEMDLSGLSIYNIKDEEILKYLLKKDGRTLQKIDPSIVTGELIETAMEHDEEKRPNLYELRINYIEDASALKYLCGVDGRWLQKVAPKCITKDIIETAVNNKSEEKRPDLSELSILAIEDEEALLYLCEIDGRYLEKVHPKFITKKLIDIAINNENKEKRPNLLKIQSPWLIEDKEAIEYMCRIDGKNIKRVASSMITKKLIQIAMDNGFSLEDIEYSNVRDSQEGMEYICSLDGRMLAYVDSNIITRELIDIAMENGFSLEDIEYSNVSHSKEGMEYICGIDGRMLRYADPSIITRELIEIAISHEDINKEPDLLTLPIEKIENIDALKCIFEINGNLLRRTSTKIQQDMNLLNISLQSPISYIPTYSTIYNLCQDENYINDDMYKENISIIMEQIKNDVYSPTSLLGLRGMVNGVVDTRFVNSDIFKLILNKMTEYYALDYDEVKYYIDLSVKVNDEILQTLNFEFLMDEYRCIYEEPVNPLTVMAPYKRFEKLFVLARYPEVQKSITHFAMSGNMDKRLSLLSNLLNASITKANGEKEERWIPYYATIITSLSTHRILYNNLIGSDETLTEEDYHTLANYVLGKHNFEINSLEDLRNYDAIREKYINNPNSSFESLKNAMLEKMYGISFTTARELWEPYSDGVLSSPKDFTEDQVEFFRGLSKIMTQDDSEVLRQVIREFESDSKLDERQVVMMKTTLKQQLTKMYNATLYKVDGKPVSDEIDGIKLYKAAGEQGDLEFNLSITALGAYSGFDPYIEDFNYKEDWNRPKAINHGFCTSYVGNNNLGTAKIKHSVLGFTNYGDTSMHLSGPYDLCSENIKFDLNEDEMGNTHTKLSKFMIPKKMIDWTRHTHNEMVFDRIEGVHKKQPTYVVFFCDEYASIRDEYDQLLKVLDEQNIILNHSSRAQIRQALKEKVGKGISDEVWDMVCSFYDTVKTSKDFENIPIVVVERKKIAENEHKKIFGDTEDYKGHLARFRDETDLSRENVQRYYHDIIIEFENNYAGNKAYHWNIANKYFGEEQRAQIIDVISNKIRTVQDLDTVNMMLEELETVIEEEYEKLGKFPSSFPSQLEEAVTRLRSEYESRKQNGTNVETVVEESNEPRYVSDFIEGKISDDAHLNEYNKYQLNYQNQYDMSEVASMIDDDLKGKITSTISAMYEKGLYLSRDRSTHSSKHIEDVILFAGLIGKQVGLDSHEMDLLMDAAMYHEAGRVNDEKEDHALVSANLALDKLSDKYEADDLRVVVAAIAYHEKEDGKDNEGRIAYSNLDSICENFGLDTNNPELMNRVRRIADCLKDADVLDRTRFLADTPNFTNPEYLRYDSSKSLIKVATQLNESYAVQDIVKESKKSEQTRVILEESLLSTNSPKETIRAYRKGYLISNNTANNARYSEEGSYGGK